MNIRYRVTLTQCERDELGMLLGGGKHPARRLKRAQILLAADAGVGDEDIAAGIGVGGSTQQIGPELAPGRAAVAEEFECCLCRAKGESLMRRLARRRFEAANRAPPGASVCRFGALSCAKGP